MLERARVLLVGMGGLGCPAALALARSGVKTLGIADDDEVDVSNLHRQILFRSEDVGRPKAEVAAARLRDVAPGIEVVVHGTRLLPSNALELVGPYDVVVEGSDNFATKFLTSDACTRAGKPVVHGAAVRWHGTALAVAARGAPCYRCLFEEVPRENVPGCDEAGVIGPVVGVLGAVMADLALALLAGRGGGTLVAFDGKTLRARKREVPARAGCGACGPDRRVRDLTYADYEIPACEVAR